MGQEETKEEASGSDVKRELVESLIAKLDSIETQANTIQTNL